MIKPDKPVPGGCEKPLGIYIHVPFCAGKCPYCDFYSVAADETLMDRYTAAVCRCFGDFLPSDEKVLVDTVYFGGGTPCLLGAARIGEILNALAAHVRFAAPEITVEVNPASGGETFFQEIAALGVNRISMGLQSASDEELRFLGRRHSAANAAKTAKLALDAGITNLSFDLMLGLPGQTAKSIEASVRFCRDHGAEHLSAYLLKIEPGTPFASRQLTLPDEETQAELYLSACEAAEQDGYLQYEISNFARSGRQSRHNLKYWRGEDYLGIGPAAHSCMDTRRFFFPRNLAAFLEHPKPCFEEEAGGFLEYAMLRLRLTEGLDTQDAGAFGIDPDRILSKARPLKRAGLLRIDGSRIALTRQGFLLSNSIITRLTS